MREHLVRRRLGIFSLKRIKLGVDPPPVRPAIAVQSRNAMNSVALRLQFTWIVVSWWNSNVFSAAPLLTLRQRSHAAAIKDQLPVNQHHDRGSGTQWVAPIQWYSGSTTPARTHTQATRLTPFFIHGRTAHAPSSTWYPSSGTVVAPLQHVTVHGYTIVSRSERNPLELPSALLSDESAAASP